MEYLKILSIIIFGSTARNEDDAYSDVDVCVITSEECGDAEVESIKKVVSDRYFIQNADINIYSANQVEAMNQYGSLFLWHLKIEGRVVFDEGYFEETTKKLSVYHKHLSELHFHADLLKDVIHSFETFCIVNELDLAQMFTISRNTCMILAHFNKEFAFGRKSAFSTASKIYNDLPLSDKEYNYLSNWKLRYERGLFDDLPLPSRDYVHYLINRCKDLIFYAVAKVSGHG